MKLGDRVCFYHSNEGREVVGIAEVVAESYPDPTAEGDPRWLCVDLAPLSALPSPVTLAQFKAHPELALSKLVKQGRLSVTPLSPEQFAIVCRLGGWKAPRG
jgi:predicted RNA-binding protein with PUA-like domain